MNYLYLEQKCAFILPNMTERVAMAELGYDVFELHISQDTFNEVTDLFYPHTMPFWIRTEQGVRIFRLIELFAEEKDFLSADLIKSVGALNYEVESFIEYDPDDGEIYTTLIHPYSFQLKETILSVTDALSQKLVLEIYECNNMSLEAILNLIEEDLELESVEPLKWMFQESGRIK